MSERLPLSYPWLKGGEDRDCVLYSIARYARNLSDALYPWRASLTELQEVRGRIMSAALACAPTLRAYPFEAMDSAESAALADRRWTHPGEPADPGRAVMTDDGSLLLAINDVDHLRCACAVSGSGVQGAFRRLVGIDEELDHALDWACAEDRGFLSSRLADAGSGLVLSALVFIPGIVAGRIFQKVALGLIGNGVEPRPRQLQPSRDGGDAAADAEEDGISPFLELRYPVPLGGEEEEGARRFSLLLRELAEGERRTRDRLRSARGEEIEDAAYRAAALFGAALTLEEEESLSLVADLRRGLAYSLAPPLQGTEAEDPFAALDAFYLFSSNPQIALAERYGGTEHEDFALGRLRADLARRLLPRYHIYRG